MPAHLRFVRRLALPLALLAAVAGAANFRLSEGGVFSDIYLSSFDGEPLVTPDGRWVFYRQDADIDEAVELWRVPAAGGAPERISGLLPAGANVCCLSLTPDGARIVFSSPQDDVAVHELFSAPVDAPPGSYAKINGPLPTGLRIGFLRGFSPDSARLLYVTDHPDEPVADTSAELWVAQVDGSGRTPIVTLPAERTFGEFQPTPDFTRAVYIADAAVADRFELYSVPIAGGTPVKLSGALVAGGDVRGFTISPTDGTVVYWADQQVDDRTELYRVPAAGGAVDKISHALAAGRSIGDALFTPDGARVLYSEASDPPGFIEIWSIAPDGSGRVGLVGALVAGGTVVGVVTDADGDGLADADRFVFVADKQTDGVFELYSTDLVTGAQVKLNPPLPANGDVVFNPTAAAPKLTPDGTTVVYAADQGTSGLDNLYRVPIGGGVSTAIGGSAVVGSSTIEGFVLAADGARAARVRRYRLLPTSSWSTHLAIASLAGGGWQQVDSCPVEVCELDLDPMFSPTDSKTIFYVADQELDEHFDLYAGDICLLCDGFEIGSTERWSAASP